MVKDIVSMNNFKLCAALLWTVNDFPTRISLSGWNGQGYKARLNCNDESGIRWPLLVVADIALVWKSLHFKGKFEKHKPPRQLTTIEILDQCHTLVFEERKEFGKYIKSAWFPDGFTSNQSKNAMIKMGK